MDPPTQGRHTQELRHNGDIYKHKNKDMNRNSDTHTHTALDTTTHSEMYTEKQM